MRTIRHPVPRQLAVLLGVLLALSPLTAQGAVKPRVVLIVPFDATALDGGAQWMGEAVADILALALAQHPAFVLLPRERLRTVGQPEAWGEPVVLPTARTLRADTALFGHLVKTPGGIEIQPRLLETERGAGAAIALDPIMVPSGEFLSRVALLPLAYIRKMGVTLRDTETAHIEKAARPTSSARALELYARASMTAAGGGQEANESAIELLGKAIEIDPNFVVAQYTLGLAHQAIGNRWKAAAQYRASTQLDPTYPEPYKALGDLFLYAPRRLYDQAVEAYTRAIELRPFYADAWVGLGEARAARGDINDAITAYQKAISYNPVNPRVYLSLGKLYYAEKGLYYEAVSAYKHALELDRTAVDARMGLGEVYEDKGLYREAIEQYREVIEINATHTGALYNLASVWEKVDPKEAIVHWQRYLSIASQLPSERDWVDIARQHLHKLQNQVKSP